MPGELLTSDLPPWVRSALDVSLTAAMLPDAIITDPLWTFSAEATVKRRDVNWATYLPDSEELGHLQRATAFLVAASLATALPVILSNQLGDERWTRSPWDGEARAAFLRGLAAEEIAANVETDGVVVPFQQFVVAEGRRGR